MSRALIVTGDDVGLHRGTTLGVVAAHEHGIVTACSVVAVGLDLHHAVELLQDRPALAVGAHLTLVGGAPLSPSREVPSLVDSDGVFLPGFVPFVRRHAAGCIRLAHVEAELRRQIETLLGLGLTLAHVNSHQHLHVLPGIVDVVARLAVEYRIGYVRSPVDRGRLGGSLVRALQVCSLGYLARTARRKLQACGLATCDGTIGIHAAGHLGSAEIAGLLPSVDGTTELVCHPGLDDGSLAAAFPWGYDWERETAALCDPAVRSAVAAAGISLVSPLGEPPG